ncbi:hypothetical protein DFA_00363 [Cavenderia fasciculata]|uniref:Uncharacterized protein n=1 Tax=Cavenderia fasciculata TaxID=261658 RepID=F4PRF0_CACFS|nr:uncharacterized protein DFA_00363 [Cavenderia fasciculata]EGG20502.1 hypothetical protein DFA_00363 [Cavenderia fasciculata]|eukprot:XP_004358352.1 hypothetical protein DFA_00363 [Cavenderia fasciculata]
MEILQQQQPPPNQVKEDDDDSHSLNNGNITKQQQDDDDVSSVVTATTEQQQDEQDNQDAYDYDSYDEEDDDELNNSGVLYKYWVENETMQDDPPEPPQHKSISELHRELSRDRILASDDDLVMLEQRKVKEQEKSGAVDTPSKVKFNDVKQVLYFEKHPEEDSLDSDYYYPNVQNYYSSDDVEDDPYAFYQQQQQQYQQQQQLQQQQQQQKSHYDYDEQVDDYDDDEEEEEEEEEEDSWSDDEDEEEEEEDEEESTEEETNGLGRSKKREIYGYDNVHNQQHVDSPTNNNDGYNNFGDQDETEDDDNNSVNSVEEHSDNENENGKEKPSFFDLSSYNPFASSTATLSAYTSPSILDSNSNGISSNSDNLRKRPEIIRYVPKFNHQKIQQDDDEDKEEEEEDDDEDEESTDQEVHVHSNGPSEELDEMVERRSEIERTLQDYRERSEYERTRLRECFNLAKQNLKQKIDLVSKQFNNAIVPEDADHEDSIKDELEKVLISLSVLQGKIDDMEHSLVEDDNTNDPSPQSFTQSTTTRKQKLASKSLVTEFMHLKEQIEKERKEKIARDKELEDITKHLLEMALQVSNTIFTLPHENQQPSSQKDSSIVPLLNGQQVNNRDGSLEIEFYRNQVKLLEERLNIWKHHNEMLHMQLLMDKQTNSQEFSNLSLKIQKVEEERDKLCLRIDNLVQELGMMEGRESMLSIMIENLMNDKESLSETIFEMNKERELITSRFSQLLLELKEMGENQVNKLQVIVNELIRERETLENDISKITADRNNLIGDLGSLHIQISSLEKDKTTVSDQYRSSEENNNRLLVQTQETIKKLETSEIKCTHLQNQLHIVNRRLSWAESEVERLTKEMNRLSLVNDDNDESSLQQDDQSLVNNSNNSEKIKSALENIRENVLKMKNTLLKEKTEILQLDSDLAHVVDKGKVDSTKTISSLKDYILREVEVTKNEISNKLQSINNDQQIAPADLLTTNEILLVEMEYQKAKLNEMQAKITKLETQIQEMSNDNNGYLGDQVGQLMRMECKIRKMEAGISELYNVDYKSPPIPPPAATTSTTTTTTVTHHYLSPVLTPTKQQNSTDDIPQHENNLISHDTIETPLPENDIDQHTNNNINNDNNNNNNNNNNIGGILKESMVFGGSAFLSSLLFAFFNSEKGGKLSSQTVLSMFKKSGIYGFGVIALTGSLLLVSPIVGNDETKSSSTTITTKPTTKMNGKEIVASLSTGAVICASVLYGKHRNMDYLLMGSTIGLALGSLSCLLTSKLKQQNNNK